MEAGSCPFLLGKMGFHSLGMGPIRKNKTENGNVVKLYAKLQLER